MKNKQLLYWAVILLTLIPIKLNAQKAIVKIACVGNSITYGAGISNRDQNSYPSQLQAYLGNNFEVKNFGENGRTAIKKGDYPYVSSKVFEDALDYQPDIVLIKLGTNDSKPQNWKYKQDFIADYEYIINRFKNLASQPRIILLTPIRCFLPENSGINAAVIEKEIRPIIEDIAWKNKLEIVNLFNIFGDQWEQSVMPDRLHPSSIGAGMMANKIYQYLTYPRQKVEKDLVESLKISKDKPFNFHGHEGFKFNNNGVTCLVVKPHFVAKGKPWLIRARFWGHEPQTDIALLENGFHIVYCDVADLYGSDEAIERWNSFYGRMVKAGFNKKVALEGMSRGGLIVYNWSAKNPEKVACIYADAPVMDLKSWPMGKGKSEGSELDCKQMIKAYNFKDETDALNWKRNPIDCAPVIAQAGIPVLHVVGDADRVVPVDENTAIFEKRMQELNHPITVIHKPGVDHHPHSLNNPEPIVQFILNATGYHRNECTYPIPGNEYRSGAGWTEGAYWHQVSDDITATIGNKNLKLLLLGNSITQGWGGNRKLVSYKPGKNALDEVLGKDTWESAGISGDRTQNLLWRIRHENYNSGHPKNVVITIGINNLISGKNSPEDTAEGIIVVAKEARKRFPQSKIILMGLLPSGEKATDQIRLKCDKIHAILATHKIKGVKYINPTKWFTDKEGTIKNGLYSNDYIHLTEKGYSVWANEIAKLIK